MKHDTFCDLLIARLLDIFCLRPEHRANVPWHGSIASPDRCAQQGPDDEIIWRYKLMVALPTPGRGSHGFCQVCTKLGRINDSARQQNLYVWVLLFPFVGFLVNKVANDVFGRQLSAIGKYTFHNARVNQMGSEGANWNTPYDIFFCQEGFCRSDKRATYCFAQFFLETRQWMLLWHSCFLAPNWVCQAHTM